MHTQRTEPYHSLTTPCKHSALMYCTSALSALNHTPPAVLHYTLRTPLTLPQRTELFVSLSHCCLFLRSLCIWVSLPVLPLAPFPLIPHPYLGLVLSGVAEGRRDPFIDLSKWGYLVVWTLYVYPYHARARGIGISAYLGTCPFPIHIGLRPLRATNHYLEVLHKRGVLCGTEFLRDSLGSMVRPKVSLFGQLVH